MFSLVTGLFDEFYREPDEFKILILGMEGCGKTTIFEAIKIELNHRGNGAFGAVQPTAGLNLSRCRGVFGSNLVFWDVGGRRALIPMWKKYAKEADAVLFIIDCTNQDTQRHSRAIFEDLVTHDVLAGVPCMLIGNKCSDVNMATAVATDWIGPSPIQKVAPVSFLYLPPDHGQWGHLIRGMCRWLVTQCAMAKAKNL